MSTPKFQVPAQAPAGFDSSFPWLMVPLNANRRVFLSEADGLELTVRNYSEPGGSAVASFDDKKPSSSIASKVLSPYIFGGPKLTREIEITGRSQGAAVLEARSAGFNTVEASLQVAVLALVSVRLKFYAVGDEAQHRTERSAANADEMLRTANRVLGAGANVTLQRVGAMESITLPGDKGGSIQIGDAERKLLQSRVNLASADLHILLIWDLEVKDPDAPDNQNVIGYTPQGGRLGMIMIEDDGAHKAGVNAGIVLAHELGHFFGLSHDDPEALNDSQNLMYKGALNGVKVSKNQFLKVNRVAARGIPPATAL
jgi:hypothetical protein